MADIRDAESVAAMAFSALMEKRWHDVPPLVHPAVLAEFRAQQLSMLRERERFARAPERTRDSTMPPEVAAWFEAQQRSYADRMGSPVEQEFGVQGYTDLLRLSPEDLLAHWLEAHDPARGIPRLLAGRADSTALRHSAALPTMRPWRRVIGSMVENDSTVQVLYRSFTVVGGALLGPDGISVLTMRRTPAGWRVWRGWQDATGFGNVIAFSPGAGSAGAGLQQLLDSAARMVVAWPASDPAGVAPGRAFVDGYAGGLSPPRAVVVESTLPDGTHSRVEIPPSAFRTLSELLAPWPVTQDSATTGRPPTATPLRKP